MPTDIATHRVRICMFYNIANRHKNIKRFSYFDVLVWMSMLLLLLLSGDIETNPGPVTTENSIPIISKSCSSNITIAHYNVQSFFQKKDIIFAELQNFDIIALSETWLSDSVSSDDIIFNNYHIPFRKDRISDAHGGILIYVSDKLYSKRRVDLEIPGIECIWLEVKSKNKSFLFSTFYRPPNSKTDILTRFENSIGLAIDDNKDDIIITGDFNLNLLKSTTSIKIDNISQQYGLTQMVKDPTHFTEHSSSLIDLFLVKHPTRVAYCGVGEPFLDQNIRYHCPIVIILNYFTPTLPSFRRKIYKFHEGNYELLRNKAANFCWNSLADPDINTYAKNISDKITELTDSTIPNKIVTIRPADPPWLHNEIRKKMRIRKRSYDKARHTNSANHWQDYRRIRNEVTNLIRHARTEYFKNLLLNCNLIHYHALTGGRH